MSAPQHPFNQVGLIHRLPKGTHRTLLRGVSHAFGASIHRKKKSITGDDYAVQAAKTVFRRLERRVKNRQPVDANTVRRTIKAVRRDMDQHFPEPAGGTVSTLPADLQGEEIEWSAPSRQTRRRYKPQQRPVQQRKGPAQ